MQTKQQEELIDLQVCATHTEQLRNIESTVDRLEGKVDKITEQVSPALAVLAKSVGVLEERMARCESQLNWGKWLGGITAAVAAITAIIKGAV